MVDQSEIPRFNLRWLLGASGTGFLGGVLLDGLFFSQWTSLSSAMRSGTIGIFFSVVGWGGCLLGFRLLIQLPNQGSPAWISGRFYIGWFIVSTLTIVCAGLLVRILLGINVLTPSILTISTLINLTIGGFITGFHLMKSKILLSKELELAHAKAQAMALRAQLSPHTLFNSLNTIAALIPENPRGAEEAVQRLSSLLRRILNALDQEHWTLDDEFQLIQDLLEIEHARFGERLSYHLDIQDPESSTLVPALILLPLVENSLKHGFRPKVGSCTLSIAAHDGRVIVTDDGVGRRQDAPEGVGLRTVRQRLEAQGGALRWLDVPEGCAVEVRLWS